MASENQPDYSLPSELIGGLLDNGIISKDFLDTHYDQIQREKDADANKVASEIASSIQTSPELQDIASKVIAALPNPEPGGQQAPPPEETPESIVTQSARFVPAMMPQPEATPAAQEIPQAQGTPTAPAPATPLPEQPPISAANVPAAINQSAANPRPEIVTSVVDQQTGDALNSQQQAAAEGNPSASMDLASQAFALQKQGAIMKAKAEMDTGNAKAAMLYQQAGDLDKMAAEQNAKRQTMLDRIDAQVQKQDAAIQQMAAMKIDENHLWANSSTPTKILWGIAIALGSFGGGPNRGMKALNDAIAQDINVQKANFDVANNSVSARRGLINDMIAEFGDVNTAAMATERVYLQKAKMQASAMAAKSNNPLIQSNLASVLGQIEEKEALLKSKMVPQAQADAAQAAANNGGVSIDAVRQLPQEMQDKYLPSLQQFAINKDDATLLKQEVLPSYESTLKNLDDAIYIAKNYPWISKLPIGSPWHQKAEILAKVGAPAARTIIDGSKSRLTKYTLEQLKSIFTDPGEMWSVPQNNLAKLEQTKALAMRGYLETLNQFGLKPPIRLTNPTWQQQFQDKTTSPF